MKAVDTRGDLPYSPLVPMLRAYYTAAPGEAVDLITDDESAFADMKEFLAGEGTGFREIYEAGAMRLQFTRPADGPSAR